MGHQGHEGQSQNARPVEDRIVSPAASGRSLRWDLFCRVIDNLGDAAVCWRLARQLTQHHGQRVRLWIDQPDVLARMVPGVRAGRSQQGVRIEAWQPDAPELARTSRNDVADRVIAGFGCELPGAYRAAMRQRRPVWINLEYFSAEAWTHGSHGLPSPKSDGLIEHFFFPGLGPRTGGTLREPNLISERDAFMQDPWARSAFLGKLGLRLQPGQRIASLFAYPTAPWPGLLEALARTGLSWTVLVPHGVLTEIDPSALPGGLALERIPFLPQDDYDRLLWCCDLNLVRGEDSLIRALWAGRPMIWQAYPQPEQAHRPKVAAWLDHLLDTPDATRSAPDGARSDGADPNPSLSLVQTRQETSDAAIRRAWQAWNADQGAPPVASALHDALAVSPRWQALSAALCRRENSLPSLAQRLLTFIDSRL